MISRAVVASWMSALAAVSNWRARNQPCFFASSAALRYMPVPFMARGVSTTLAPSIRISFDQRIALLRADHRQPDAGVAARRLDDRLTGFQASVPFGRFDDVERQPVLDRGGRIEELGLHIKPHAFGGEVVDADDRRVADRVEHAVEQPSASLGGSDRPDIHGRAPYGLVLPDPAPSRARMLDPPLKIS